MILLDPEYLAQKQIAHHSYPFSEKILVINNVENLSSVCIAAQAKVDEGILDRFVIARNVLEHFALKRSDFDDWQYYNALGPLNAIYEAKSEYLLFVTGDVYLKKPVQWIEKALKIMEKDSRVKVANLTWNDNYKEAKEESYKRSWNFYYAKRGFSDQMFLVRTEEFQRPIYSEIREEGSHYPRGDVFEKRAFSYLLNHNFERITYRHGAYRHEDGNFFKE